MEASTWREYEQISWLDSWGWYASVSDSDSILVECPSLSRLGTSDLDPARITPISHNHDIAELSEPEPSGRATLPDRTSDKPNGHVLMPTCRRMLECRALRINPVQFRALDT